MSRLTTEARVAATALGGRTGAAPGVLARTCAWTLSVVTILTRRAAAGAAGGAAGERPPPKPRPSITATNSPPTAGAVVPQRVAAGGWPSEGGPDEA